MPRKCAVPACTAHQKRGSHIGMFQVPKDEDRKKQWEQAIGIKLGKSHIVCGVHFKDEDKTTQKIFRDSDDNIVGIGLYNRRLLCSDAVPSLFLPKKTVHLDIDCSTVGPVKENVYNFQNSCDTESSEDIERSDNEEIIILKDESDKSKQITENTQPNFKTVKKRKNEMTSENDLLFDSLLFQISLPSYWSRITPFNNIDCIVFATFILDEQLSNLTPFKQVCVYRNGNIVYNYNGQEVETNLDARLTSVESLEKSIEYFDSWSEKASK